MNSKGSELRLVASLVIIAETSLVQIHLAQPAAATAYTILLVASVIIWVARGGSTHD